MNRRKARCRPGRAGAEKPQVIVAQFDRLRNKSWGENMSEMHEGHRSRMKKRFLENGLEGFDDHNVLELLLFYAQPRQDTNATAHRLMNAFGSLDGVFEAPPEALMSVKGVGENAATLIRLVPEAARRYRIAKEAPGDILSSAAAAGRFLIPFFLNCTEETVYLVCLDAKLKVIDCRLLSTGGTTSASVSIRQIVSTALLQNATSAILAHNHTSGIALPSPEDERVTLQVRDALAMVGVTLADHIIVAGEDFVSLADDGLLRR